MEVLVTGGGGFLGKHLVSELGERGHRVTLLFRGSEEGQDLTNAEWTRDAFRHAGAPDAVVHLAAKCGGIGANRARPGEFFRDNMLMGIHAIDAALRCGIGKFVCVGTVCAYPKFTPVPFKEDDIWNGYPEETNAPYGLAKKMLMVMLQAYRQQYGMNGIYLIPVNLYGPGDNFDLESSHVIPALIRKFHEAVQKRHDVVECWGTGSASREFLYVKDAARAIVDGLERYDDPDPVNIGSGSEITIRDLTEKIASMTGFKGEIAWDPSKPDGQPRRCLDVSRAWDRLCFKAETGLDEGLRKTYLWYIESLLLGDES